jgi:hypothetical protein
MIYHGVSTEEAVLMRMNSAPRSAAEKLGQLFKESESSTDRPSVADSRRFLKGMGTREWDSGRPANARLSGVEYRRVWGILSGEQARRVN